MQVVRALRAFFALKDWELEGGYRRECPGLDPIATENHNGSTLVDDKHAYDADAEEHSGRCV